MYIVTQIILHTPFGRVGGMSSGGIGRAATVTYYLLATKRDQPYTINGLVKMLPLLSLLSLTVMCLRGSRCNSGNALHSDHVDLVVHGC